MASKKSRAKWSNQAEFILSCIGLCVGLGNIWRFPYICYKNGGGAFLLPFCFFLVVVSLPLVYLQFTYGQYSSLGPGRVWICCPLFQGVGDAMMVLTYIVSIYYPVIVSWILYYFAMVFSPSLPWASCDNEWNTRACYIRGTVINQSSISNDTFPNFTKVNETLSNITNVKRTTASEEFWESVMGYAMNKVFLLLSRRQVLELTDGIDTMGSIRWQLMLCLLACTVTVMLCLIRGIHSSGKIMYVAAILPYVILSILFIRGVMLPGAASGLKYYLVPRWNELANVQVWVDAAVQNIYSCSLATGSLVNLASFNQFQNDIFRQALIVVLVDAFTSIFAGCTIFATLGYMAERSNVPIDTVVDQGPGVAFVVYPETLATLPLPQLWSALFFVTLIAVGLDSQIAHVQVITVGLKDKFANLLGNRDTTVLVGTSLSCFLLGLMLVTQGGMYILQLVDWYLSTFSILLISFSEVTALAWIYGTERLYNNLEMMLGFRPSLVWKLLWKYVSPLLLLSLWIIGVVQHEPVTYGPKAYPSWSIGVGFVIGLLPLMPIPLKMAVGLVMKRTGGIMKRLKDLSQPLPSWKPAISNVTGTNDVEIGMLQ